MRRTLDSHLSIRRIRLELDLPAVVSRTAGGVVAIDDDRWEARCPFHDDGDPSFYVWRNAEDGSWLAGCWSCDYGFGDAIDFLQRAEDLDFAGALARARELAADPELRRRPDAAVKVEADLSRECAGLARGDKADRLVARFLGEKGLDGDAGWLRTQFRLGITRAGLLAIPNWSGARCCSIKLRDPRAGWEWGSFKGSRHEELYGAWRDVDASRPAVVCEGESDTWAMALWWGDRAVPLGLPGARRRPQPSWIARLADREVYLMLDADEAGDGGLATWREALPWARPVILPRGSDARSAGRDAVREALLAAKRGETA